MATTQHKSYLKVKNEEAYANVFITHFPDEERSEGRPLRTAPCYDRLKALGAVFGQKFGWERANWFAPDGVPQEDHWSFRRSSYFEHVGNEVRNVAKNAGLLDMSAFLPRRGFLAEVLKRLWIILNLINCKKMLVGWPCAMP